MKVASHSPHGVDDKDLVETLGATGEERDARYLSCQGSRDLDGVADRDLGSLSGSSGLLLLGVDDSSNRRQVWDRLQ